MSNYKHSFEYRYLVGSGSTLVDPTKSTADLLPLQLGLFNSKTYKAIPVGTSAKQVPEVILGYGSPHEGKIPWTNAEESVKSMPIRADKVIAWRKSLPQKAVNHKVAVGWDGVSDCKNITIKCGETYTLAVQVEGNPATRFFAQKPLTARYVYTAPCCPDGNPTAEASVEPMIDQFVTEINSDKFISPFIKAEKIVEYSVAPTAPTLVYNSYTITVADEGGISALAKIQEAYQSLGYVSLERIDRVGIYSTYKIVVADGTDTPDAYSSQAITTIPNCEDCPSGYTLVDTRYVYKIDLADGGDDISSDLLVLLPGEGIVAAFKSSGEPDFIGSYVLTFDSDVSSTLQETLEGLDDEDAFIGAPQLISVIPAYCELTNVFSTPWTEGDDYYREGKTLCMTFGAKNCSNPQGVTFSELAAYYADNELVAIDDSASATGDCAESIEATVYSDNLLKEDECYTGVATFTTPDGYKGFKWVECCEDDDTKGTVSKIGIVLTGAYVDTQFSKCAFEFTDFVELDLPRIIVTQGNALDELGKCNVAWDVTELQKPQYPTGVGRNVYKRAIESSQLLHQPYDDSPRWREILGYNYDFIDFDKYYKTYYLDYVALDKSSVSLGYTNADIKQTLAISFPEEVDTTGFEALLESWIGSVRPDLIDIDKKDSLFR